MSCMKKLVGFALILFVFLMSIWIVSAAPEDVIFRLSGTTNAHGENVSGSGSYIVNISYTSLFGPYVGA